LVFVGFALLCFVFDNLYVGVVVVVVVDVDVVVVDFAVLNRHRHDGRAAAFAVGEQCVASRTAAAAVVVVVVAVVAGVCCSYRFPAAAAKVSRGRPLLRPKVSSKPRDDRQQTRPFPPSL